MRLLSHLMTGTGGKQQWSPEGAGWVKPGYHSKGPGRTANTFNRPPLHNPTGWPRSNVTNAIYGHYSISMTVCHFVCNIPTPFPALPTPTPQPEHFFCSCPLRRVPPMGLASGWLAGLAVLQVWVEVNMTLSRLLHCRKSICQSASETGGGRLVG